jgi:hypothetical protein
MQMGIALGCEQVDESVDGSAGAGVSTPHDAEWLEHDDATRLPPLQPNKGLAVPSLKERCCICRRALIVVMSEATPTKVCPVHSTAGTQHIR